MRNIQKEKGKLFVISGPSGAGKGTVCRRLIEEGVAEVSISMTTRKPRPGEVNGREYFFVNTEEFKESIAKGELLEYAHVFDNMYGTPKKAVMRKLNKGKNVVLEIDVQGGLQVKRAMPETVMIFLLPPDLKTLHDRIVGRKTETEDAIIKRSQEALNEIKLLGEYDYYVINDDIDMAVVDVENIIKAERLRVPDKVKPIIRKYE